MIMISKSVQLSNEAASLIKLEKFEEALPLLQKALSDIGSSKHISRKFRNLKPCGSNEIYTARSIEIINNSALRDNRELFKGECDEGMRTYPEPLEMIIHAIGDIDCHPIEQAIVGAIVNYNLGILMTRRQEDDKAYPYFKKSLSLKQTYSSFYQNKTKFDFLQIAILHNQGHILYRNKQYAEALAKYRTAQQKSTDNCNNPSIGLIDKALSLNCIGIAIMQISQGSDDGIEESLHNLSEALTVSSSVKDDKDCQEYDRFFRDKMTATILNNIGRVRALRGESKEALSLFKKVFKIRMRILGEDHLDTIAVHFNEAEALLLDGKTKKALEKLHQFISASSTHLKHDLVAVFTLFAEAYVESNNYPKAVMFYLSALRKLKAAPHPDKKRIAQILNSIGDLFCKLGKLDSALKVYNEELDLELRLYNPNDSKIIVTVLNVAHVYYHKNAFHRSLEKYTEGLNMQRQVKGANARLDLASTLESIGLVNSRLERPKESTNAYLEALVVKKEELGEEHVDVSSLLNTIGMVYFRNARYDDALKYFEESFSIRSQGRSSNYGSFASVMFNIAMTHVEKRNYIAGLASFQKCLDIISSETDQDQADNKMKILTLEGIRLVYERMGCPKNASYIHQEAKKLRRASEIMCVNTSDLHQEVRESRRASV